jgi:hypothetical protein
MSIWELEQASENYTLMNELVRAYHPVLAEAKIIIYCSDKNKIKSNAIIMAEASRASSKMKASVNADFTITIYVGPWSDLTPIQKKACMDHELCHCGFQYEPVKEVVGRSRTGTPRMKVVKDEHGRTQYTNDVKRDVDGIPKWKLIDHDLEDFYDIVHRYGLWNENLRSFKQAIDQSEVTEEGAA